MTTLHLDHYRDNESWFGQAHVIRQSEHMFKRHGPMDRIEALERPR
jgi:hypothetical protein